MHRNFIKSSANTNLNLVIFGGQMVIKQTTVLLQISQQKYNIIINIITIKPHKIWHGVLFLDFGCMISAAYNSPNKTHWGHHHKQHLFSLKTCIYFFESNFASLNYQIYTKNIVWLDTQPNENIWEALHFIIHILQKNCFPTITLHMHNS